MPASASTTGTGAARCWSRSFDGFARRRQALALAKAAAQGAGLALLPVNMFTRKLQQGRLVWPVLQALHHGGYGLTWLQSRPQTQAMAVLSAWLGEQHATIAAEKINKNSL